MIRPPRIRNLVLIFLGSFTSTFSLTTPPIYFTPRFYLSLAKSTSPSSGLNYPLSCLSDLSPSGTLLIGAVTLAGNLSLGTELRFGGREFLRGGRLLETLVFGAVGRVFCLRGGLLSTLSTIVLYLVNFSWFLLNSNLFSSIYCRRFSGLFLLPILNWGLTSVACFLTIGLTSVTGSILAGTFLLTGSGSSSSTEPDFHDEELMLSSCLSKCYSIESSGEGLFGCALLDQRLFFLVWA